MYALYYLLNEENTKGCTMIIYYLCLDVHILSLIYLQ